MKESWNRFKDTIEFQFCLAGFMFFLLTVAYASLNETSGSILKLLLCIGIASLIGIIRFGHEVQVTIFTALLIEIETLTMLWIPPSFNLLKVLLLYSVVNSMIGIIIVIAKKCCLLQRLS